jgi:hypothetical protein
MNDQAYDSRPETWEHIHQVQFLMWQVITALQRRALDHDQSKLVSPEVEVFDRVTPRLRGMTYDSDEYRATLIDMGEGLRHHYSENDHHPEHGDGTLGWMSLVQLLELLCDWKAATMRHDNGDLRRSIEQNSDRFGYGDEMKRLLLNTAEEFGWL